MDLDGPEPVLGGAREMIVFMAVVLAVAVPGAVALLVQNDRELRDEETEDA